MAEINKLPHKIVLNVDKVAKEVGSARVAKMCIRDRIIAMNAKQHNKQLNKSSKADVT